MDFLEDMSHGMSATAGTDDMAGASSSDILPAAGANDPGKDRPKPSKARMATGTWALEQLDACTEDLTWSEDHARQGLNSSEAGQTVRR